ncbi:hypothetical protein [Streptomyces wuyuanensis]|uniref:Uncharacterized protein n=1 Tax=Streptomyces wuyuanensis TaxID=1196353 RepID=A0A1H0B3M6_9ACTN|nr:hypothetical protein [Streptomyces wuyuanensis]SDN40239.1 hypothetical protein SAMN05444921_12633 [Streptomyces wuyuanensis]
MEWWIWLIIAVTVLAVAASSAVALQAWRRSGGVIAGGKPQTGKRGGTT